MNHELKRLQKRWLAKTGADMPYEIACLPARQVRAAVEKTEAGETVFVPRSPVTAGVDQVDESIRDWDSDSEY